MSNKNLANRLIELGEKLDETKTEKAQIDGKKKSLLEQLSKKFNCSTIEQGKALREKKIKERQKKISVLEIGVEELEAAFE